jgi:hypothetical protein
MLLSVTKPEPGRSVNDLFFKFCTKRASLGRALQVFGTEFSFKNRALARRAIAVSSLTDKSVLALC